MRLPVLPLLRKMPFKVMAGAGMGGGAFMKAQMVQPEGFHAELSTVWYNDRNMKNIPLSSTFFFNTWYIVIFKNYKLVMLYR